MQAQRALKVFWLVNSNALNEMNPDKTTNGTSNVKDENDTFDMKNPKDG